jgi:translation initiation factor 5B
VNAQLFFKKHDTAPCISIVPTSSLTSDGIGNLMALVVELSQTNLSDRISYSTELQCVVMGVKAISGIGTTIDVCLVNGKLSIDDTIIIAGQKGPIVTKVSDLLTTRPNRVPRGKNSFVQNKQVVGTCIVKIKADNLEKSLGGLPLYVAEEKCEIELYKKEMAKMLEQSLKSMKLQEIGVFVHAPTLGKLESFLKYLRAIKLPVAGINVGPVQRLDVAKAAFMAPSKEKDSLFSYILALDVKVEPDAKDYADNDNVQITIYSEKYIYAYKFVVTCIKHYIKIKSLR